MKFLAILLLVCATGCQTITTKLMKPDAARLAEKYITIKGTLAAPPALFNGNKRLLIYLAEQPEPERQESVLKDSNGNVVTDNDGNEIKAPKEEKVVAKEVITCVSENEQNKSVLINVRAGLNNPKTADKVVYIYGQRVVGPWNEYTTGINFAIFAIGYYVPESGQYVIIQTGYGDGMFDGVNWMGFLKQIGATAIKGAL